MIVQEDSLGRKVKTEFMMSGEDYLVDYLPGYWEKKTLAKKNNLSVCRLKKNLQNNKTSSFNMGKKNCVCNTNFNIKM